MNEQQINELQTSLLQFTGTENYYKHLLGVIYTDGVRHLCETAECYWLLDVISSYQPQLRRHKDFRLHSMQFWTLKVIGSLGIVTCRADSDVVPAIEQKIPYTDFPLPEIDIWVGRDSLGMIAMLKSEY